MRGQIEHNIDRPLVQEVFFPIHFLHRHFKQLFNKQFKAMNQTNQLQDEPQHKLKAKRTFKKRIKT